MIKDILVLFGIVILITFGYFHLTEKIRMTKVILITKGMIVLITFANYGKID